MSGGHWNYIQTHPDIECIADEMREIAKGQDLYAYNKEEEEEEEGYKHPISPEAASLFFEAADMVENALKAIQRCDWFISCDDSEESFISRWKEELEENSQP